MGTQSEQSLVEADRQLHLEHDAEGALHQSARLIHADSHFVEVVVSISRVPSPEGTVSYLVLHVEDARQRAAREADMAMYRAKADGRNRISVATPFAEAQNGQVMHNGAT